MLHLSIDYNCYKRKPVWKNLTKTVTAIPIEKLEFSNPSLVSKSVGKSNVNYAYAHKQP